MTENSRFWPMIYEADIDTPEVSQMMRERDDELNEIEEQIQKLNDKQEKRRKDWREKLWNKRVEEEIAFFCDGCGNPILLAKHNDRYSVKAAKEGLCKSCHDNLREKEAKERIVSTLTGCKPLYVNMKSVGYSNRHEEVEAVVVETAEGEKVELKAQRRSLNGYIEMKRLDEEEFEEKYVEEEE